MDKPSNVRVITLKELWNIFARRWWVMILAAVFCVGGFYTAKKVTYQPHYQSTATLYILNQSDNKKNNFTEDFSLALEVVNDCDYLLKSHSVLDKVIDELNLNISYEDLNDMIDTFNPENTRILEVMVEADSPERAKEIVDCVCRMGTDSITQAMGFQQVNLYEYGTLETKPSNQTRLLTYILISFIAMVLTYTVFLILFVFDDTLRTDEDIKEYLGLTVLGDIPNVDSTRSKKYGYYSSERHSKKGRKSSGKNHVKASRQ